MRSNSWLSPAVGMAALCVCLGWPVAGSAQEKPKAPKPPGPRGHVIQVDLDRLPPDLAKQLAPYAMGGPERPEKPPSGPPLDPAGKAGPKEKPGWPDHAAPDRVLELVQLLVHGPKRPGPKQEPKHGEKPEPKAEHGPKGPGPAHGPTGPGGGNTITITIQIPEHVAARLLDAVEGKAAKKPHEPKEHGPKGPEKPPKKPKPKKDD